jgi:hypothetical protein
LPAFLTIWQDGQILSVNVLREYLQEHDIADSNSLLTSTFTVIFAGVPKNQLTISVMIVISSSLSAISKSSASLRSIELSNCKYLLKSKNSSTI